MKVTGIVLLFALVSAFKSGSGSPQVFSDIYTFCEFKFGERAPLAFPDKLWTVKLMESTVHFTLCGSVQAKCNNQTSACLVQGDQVIHFDDGFSTGNEDFSLVSSSGAKCPSDPSKNYSLLISLQCRESIKFKPRLISVEDCVLEIMMLKPDCHLKCSELVQGSYLLDISTFRTSFQVESGSRRFSLSLCGPNPTCLNDVTTCEFKGTEIIPLATISSQHINYDITKNELTARGRYKENRIIRNVQVFMKCNWETDLANAKYRNVSIQGKNYKFEIESSFGCIKLPHNCAFLDTDYLNFNLAKLYREEGWEIAGVPEGRIFMNICGPLKNTYSTCAAQYSQVCHILNNNYINRGSILTSFASHDDVITASFVSGSTCHENPQFLYSTEIEFRCSRTEKGPVFIRSTQCRMFLIWETQHACPVDVYKSQNCYVNDRVSKRDFQKLYNKTDKIYPITADKKTKLVYNLCGPIHETCNGFTNASVCLKSEAKEIVIGWDNRELISENGQVRMELRGSTCSNRIQKSEAFIHFLCNYANPPPPPEIRVIEDNCRYNVTIFTSVACFSQGVFKDCVYNTVNTTYDLSPLIQKSRNYVISHGNIDYIFNLCGPIISTSESLCKGDSMFCWRNKTEMNIKKQYMSLGGVGGPRLRNDTLVVGGTPGAFCPGLGYYKSIIHFQCSETKFPPEFLSKDECVYNFKWKTPEACPRIKDCVVQSSKVDFSLDLTKLQKKSLKVKVDNNTKQYEFNLCSEVYSEYSDGQKNTHALKRNYFTRNTNSYVLLDLQKTCNGSEISKVIFQLKCSETGDYYEQISFEDCTLNMTLGTNTECGKKEVRVVYEIMKPEVPTNKTENNCTLTNGYTGYEFKLSKIKLEKIYFNNTIFTVNFGQDSAFCGGLFCKNGSKILENMCPVSTFDHSRKLVTMQFNDSSRCRSNGSYELKIVLKCNETRTGGKILQDGICNVVVSYDMPEVCHLVKQEILPADHTAVIAGTATSVVAILLVLAFVIYLNRRRCSHYMRMLPFYKDKSAVPIYIRNFRD